MSNENISLTEQLKKLKNELEDSGEYDELKKKAIEERRKFDKFGEIVSKINNKS